MELLVNGVRRSVGSHPDPERALLYVLRDELNLTGAKYGCGEGQCGACTVLLDGAPVRSCLTPLKTAQGKGITTIESLEQNGRLHPVQEAFIEEDAIQCGYCTAGMIMSSVGLLRRNPHPAESEIRSALQGNICRCGTYPRIVEAVRRAALSGGRNA
jgi:aerobic-type carbon monoxide dehydrogenase small subunit (CoxS/CutS family)